MAAPAASPHAAADDLPSSEHAAPVVPTPLSLNGHLGHLTPEQQQLYDTFRAEQLPVHAETLAYLEGLDRARIVKAGAEATPEALAKLRADREAEWPYELTRFLRATKWKLEDTRKVYGAYLAWRRAKKIDCILDQLPFNGLLIDRVVGNNANGFDKKGRPLYIEKSGTVLTDGILKSFTDEDILNGHLWQQENSCLRAAESSAKRGEHIELFTQIVDLNGLNMGTQRAIKFTKLLFAADAAYYPERLGDLYIVNAPWVFPIIWKLVKGWIDPVTRSKIHVVPGNPSSTLLAAIDAENLPAEYGGSCNKCPNSPQCCKQYSLHEFIELLPLKASQPDLISALTNEIIKAGKKKEVVVEMKENEVVEWFWTQQGKENDDIDFAVTFQAQAAEPPIHVVEKSRIENGGNFPAQASFQAPAPGTLTIVWDNHYSWMSAKSISYLVRKIDARRHCLMPAGAVFGSGAAGEAPAVALALKAVAETKATAAAAASS